MGILSFSLFDEEQFFGESIPRAQGRPTQPVAELTEG